MSKFNVGDRVRLLRDGYSTKGATGLTATVKPFDDGTLVSDDGDYLVKLDSPYEKRSMAVASGYTRVKPDGIELVQPASPPSPVITKTVKEIVPGEFGPVSVRRYDRDGADHVRVSLFHSDEMYRALDASELREAARIFNELADALDDQ